LIALAFFLITFAVMLGIFGRRDQSLAITSMEEDKYEPLVDDIENAAVSKPAPRQEDMQHCQQC